jgi:hypothetical protein
VVASADKRLIRAKLVGGPSHGKLGEFLWPHSQVLPPRLRVVKNGVIYILYDNHPPRYIHEPESKMEQGVLAEEGKWYGLS